MFVSVATRRSFVGAAKAAGVSAQVATRAVASLEERLDVRLLHRTTRAVSLTEDGEGYLARAKSLLADFDMLESPESEELRGAVAVAAPVLLGQMHVAPIVHEFLAAHPAVGIRLSLHDRVVSLAEEGIDVAVRIGALTDSSLRAKVVGHVSSVLCASPDYLAARGVPRTVTDLARHDGIAFTQTTPVADRWSFGGRARRPNDVEPRVRLTVNTARAALDAAVAGLGVVRVYSYQAAPFVREGALKVVLPRADPAKIPVSVVRLPGAQGRVARGFADWVASSLPSRLTTI